MKRTASSYVKIVIVCVIVLAMFCLCVWRMLKVQIVSPEAYTQSTTSVQTYTQSISATRGEIVDSNGDAIIENKVGYNVVIEPDTFPEDNAAGNDVLLRIFDVFAENDITWTGSIPITDTEPYHFTEDEDAVTRLKSNLNLNVYATAENCIDKLISDYDIPEDMSRESQYQLASVRYEMQLRGFSMSNQFTLMEDVPLDVVMDLKEKSVMMPGMNITEEAVRSIAQGDVIPHEIGTVGPIYAEEYEELSAQGYSIDDIVGKSGIERALDLTLRGSDGIKEITVENGEVVETKITTPVTAGSTVQLTVNSDFQRELQTILDNFIANFDLLRDSNTTELGEVNCGAIVVLDVEDGGILGMATAPTYDLNEYKSDYSSLLEQDNNPLFNRATNGLYRPGSTFKTITAVAGLNEGIVDAESTYYCGHKYEFYDVTYNCTGYHGDIGVARALQVSCNIYFYQLSEQLTIDRISDYAERFGLGQTTGIETGDSLGHLSNQETFEDLGVTWTVGQVLQSGIGQGEWAVTPIQMANVACTLANNGTRYETHLVDSIWDYTHTTCLETYEPVIAGEVDPVDDSVFETVKEGMVLASTNNFPSKYSLSNLSYDVAIKTGTPQNDSRVQDSFFIGYYPADNPKIAFAGVIEGGEYSKYMIRSIIQAYEKYVQGKNVTVENFGSGIRTNAETSEEITDDTMILTTETSESAILETFASETLPLSIESE